MPPARKHQARAAFKACTRDELAEKVDQLIRNVRTLPLAYHVVVFADSTGLYWARAAGWRERHLREQLEGAEVGYYNRRATHAELLDDVIHLARQQGWFCE